MRTYVLGTIMALSSVATWVMAEENILARLASSCERDIITHCGRVKSGEGRIVSCLFSNDDKISSECGMALNDATLQYETVGANLSELIDACETDRENYCPTEDWGGGGVVKCLHSQSYVTESVSTSCRLTLKKFGLM